MINGNILYFGYGDIAVRTQFLFNEIQFQQFKPPQEIGTYVEYDKVEWIGECVKFELNEEECVWWVKKLQKVLDRDTNAFEFKGYVFDFSNYNRKSVDVVVKNIYKIYNNLLTIVAC